MKTTSWSRPLAKWTFTVVTVLLLFGWALSPGSEHEVGTGRSVQIADGFLTIRMWVGERAAPGTPSDMAPNGTVPDTRNVPLWIVLLALAVPAVLLWLWDGRASRGAGPARVGPGPSSAG